MSRTRSKAMCQSPDAKRKMIASNPTAILAALKKNDMDLKDFKKKDIF